MVEKRATILNNGNLEEISDSDTLTNIGSLMNDINDGTTTVNNPEATNFKGSNIEASPHSNSNTAVIEFKSSGSNTKFIQTNPKLKSFEIDSDLKLVELLTQFENNLNDDSNNSYTLSSNNVSFSSSTYKIGSYSASFNGSNSYINCGNSFNLNFERDEEFSFEFWVYLSSKNANQMFFTKRKSSANNWTGVSIYVGSDNTVRFLLLADSGTGNYIQAKTSATLDIGQWHHIVGTYNGSSLLSGTKIYINGSEATLSGSIDNLSSNISNSENFYVGGDYVNNINYLDGFLDRFVVYEKILTADEISKHYNSGNGYSDVYNENIIKVTPFKCMLPDESVLAQSSIQYLNLEDANDFESSYTLTGDQWLYLYATDETSWSTKKLFFSTTKPYARGFHPTKNAKYIGSIRLNSNIKIEKFRKEGCNVLYQVSQIAYTNTTTSTSLVTVDLSDHIPETTNVAFAFSYQLTIDDTYVSYIRGKKQDNTAKDWPDESGQGKRYYPAIVKTNDDREVYHNSNTTRTEDTKLYVLGYIENVDNPLQNVA